MLPDVYLIGAPKSGTTSLARWLSAHPDVYFSIPKEPFYWAEDYPRVRDHYGFGCRESYEALFSGAGARSALHRAEGSTAYLYSRAAVPQIMAAVDDPKFIVALRDPVDLLVSWHRTQLVALNEDEPDFLKAWRRSVAGGLPDTDPLDAQFVDYPRIGALGAAVSRLLDVVPPDRLHMLAFDDLRRDPAAVWAALTRFLEISGQPSPAFTAYNISTKKYRWPLLRRLTHRPPGPLEAPVRALRQWSRTTQRPMVARTKKRMWTKQDKPSISDAARAEVADFFAADVKLLADLLPIDVSAWCSSAP